MNKRLNCVIRNISCFDKFFNMTSSAYFKYKAILLLIKFAIIHCELLVKRPISFHSCFLVPDYMNFITYLTTFPKLTRFPKQQNEFWPKNNY